MSYLVAREQFIKGGKKKEGTAHSPLAIGLMSSFSQFGPTSYSHSTHWPCRWDSALASFLPEDWSWDLGSARTVLAKGVRGRGRLVDGQREGEGEGEATKCRGRWINYHTCADLEEIGGQHVCMEVGRLGSCAVWRCHVWQKCMMSLPFQGVGGPDAVCRWKSESVWGEK